MSALLSFGAGALFALGLAVSGMTRPAKVSGFLDVAGAWDPSLALVMGGAVTVFFVAWRLSLRRARPLLGGEFAPPPPPRIDARLVGGAALFGVGWGLSGFCPGPALVSVGALSRDALLFAPAMVLAIGGFRLVERVARRSTSSPSASAPTSPSLRPEVDRLSSCG